MKKLIIALVVSLSATLASPAKAAEAKTLVIIDSGFNTQLLAGSIVEEACFIEYGKCPNGQASMIGAGAATLASTDADKDKAFNHGTTMAFIARSIDPGVRLVLVRVVGRSDKGYANTYTTRVIATALDYVAANAARLNVGAVSMSIGRAYKEAACPIEASLQAKISQLKVTGIATFASAGNGSNPGKVDYPACIPDVIAVGATDTRYTVRGVTGWVYPVMLISNGGPDLDLYSLGRYNSVNLNGTPMLAIGTSAANVAVASKWTQSLSQGGTYDSIWSTIQGGLEKAYRSLTDVVQKQFSVA